MAPVVINCPSNISKSVELGTLQSPVSWLKPTAIGQSDSVSLIHESHQPGDTFNAESVTYVSYIFEDGSNNKAFCNFSVTFKQGT